MKLVFIHGWGLDAHFWDALAPLLAQFPQQRIDLGFFGGTPEMIDSRDNILIGHSLGFIRGMQKKDWKAWIAVNSFPRFVTSDARKGCLPAFVLREMRARLNADAQKTLESFYKMIGAKAPQGSPDTEKLCAGLDELRDRDAGDLKAIPGLALASRNDPLVPTDASEALGPNIIWHENGGHVLPQSDPTWCAKHIREFCEKL